MGGWDDELSRYTPESPLNQNLIQCLVHTSRTGHIQQQQSLLQLRPSSDSNAHSGAGLGGQVEVAASSQMETSDWQIQCGAPNERKDVACPRGEQAR